MWQDLKQLLIEEQVITEEEIKKCSSIKELKDNNDEDYFLYFGLISEEGLCNVLSRKLSIEIIDIKQEKLSLEIIESVPISMIYKYNILPFYMNEDALYIVCVNPMKNEFVKELKFIIKKQIKVFIALKSSVVYLINKYYAKSSVDNTIYQLEKQSATKNIGNSMNTDDLKVKESPAVRLVDYIIKEAINERASDIHFEPYGNKCRVRYRTDGYMKEVMNLPKDGYDSLCSRIKVMSGINIVENRIPQDGKINSDAYDFRVSTIPTVNGEKVVIRILYKNNFYNSLSEMGFDNNSENIIKNLLDCGRGMLLICGPTGSGKTSTLYTILNYINKKDINIVTIEDPVEYILYGINQINVNGKMNLTFASGLRSVLRQDPDVIMIGEIRDEETAQIAVRASITGHMVISTIHTNDAAGAITRLKDMGIPEYLLGDSLTAVISQRLVRKVCNNCKKQYYPSASEIKTYGLSPNFVSSYGSGCSKCNNTGYFGRTICYEMLIMDDYIREVLTDKDCLDKIRKYNRHIGNFTIQENCINLIKSGMTTLDELKRLALFSM